MSEFLLPAARPAAAQTSSTDRAALRQAAQALEASFLAEMLKFAGAGKARRAFGGGAGEDAFSSLLVREQATRLAEAGGVGIAERLFNAMLNAQGEVAAEEGDDVR